jgi:hypothetical protein
MAQQIKHVGKTNDRKVLVLYREVPGDEHMCLVIYPEVLNASWQDAIQKVVESEEALKEAPRQYLNRLSDLMFVLARVLNRHRSDGTVGDDVYWKSERLARGA